MMRFLMGVVVGAAGYWAYEQGLLPFGTSAGLTNVMGGSSPPSEIIRPTAHEISSRPAEPIPS